MTFSGTVDDSTVPTASIVAMSPVSNQPSLAPAVSGGRKIEIGSTQSTDRGPASVRGRAVVHHWAVIVIDDSRLNTKQRLALLQPLIGIRRAFQFARLRCWAAVGQSTGLVSVIPHAWITSTPSLRKRSAMICGQSSATDMATPQRGDVPVVSAINPSNEPQTVGTPALNVTFSVVISQWRLGRVEFCLPWRASRAPTIGAACGKPNH